MTLIPIALSRSRRHVLNLDAAYAEGAGCDRLQAEKRAKEERASMEAQVKQAPAIGRSIGPVVEASALSAFISKNRKVECWDIKTWINDNIEAHDRARITSRTPARQCKEYHLMKNFNPLSVHRQYDPEEERRNKNMAVALARARRNARPLEVRRKLLAQIEEARIARALMTEEVRIAEALMTEEARMARQISMTRQAQVHDTHQPDMSQPLKSRRAQGEVHPVNPAPPLLIPSTSIPLLSNMLTRLHQAGNLHQGNLKSAG